MNRDIMTPEMAKLVLEATRTLDRASIFEGNTQKPFDFQVFRLNIGSGTARDENNPIRIGVQFKSLYVIGASDPGLTVKMKPNAVETYQSSIPLTLRDTLNFGLPISGANFFWDTQYPSSSSAYVDILISLSSEFKSGALIGGRGGVKTDIYENFEVIAIAVVNGTSTAVQLTNTGVAGGATNGDQQWLIENRGNDQLYLGKSNVGIGTATFGTLQPGERIKWNNRTALWAAANWTASMPGPYVLREY